MKAIAAAIIIALVGLLLIGFQQYRVIALKGEVAIEAKAKSEAIEANQESQATITTLRVEVARNAAYQKDLNRRIKASEDKARKAEKDFENLKRNSPAVRDWASQPLPDGLRSKAGAGHKDLGGSSRSP